MTQTLFELRRAAGLTQAEAARRIDVTQPALQAWEKGRSVPTMRNIREMARVYSVDPMLIFKALLDMEADDE